MLKSLERQRRHEESYSRVPMSSELREFIAESRKKQTLYANCEGFYNHRELEISNRNPLENFVINTMYYEQKLQGKLTLAQSMVVEKILQKMIDCAVKFKSNQIRFSAVWVYYFDYEKKSTVGTPVFQILSPRSSSTFYVSVEEHVFHSWDEYMDTPLFPPSFVCSPRHGKYSQVAGENMVDLEYITSRCLVSKKQPKTIITLSAYSQVIVFPLLQNKWETVKMKTVIVARKLYQMAQKLAEKLMQNWSTFVDIAEKVIVLISITIYIKEIFSMGKAIETLRSGLFMFFNSHVHFDFAEKLLTTGTLNFNLPTKELINPCRGEESSVDKKDCIELLSGFIELIKYPTMAKFNSFFCKHSTLVFDVIDKLISCLMFCGPKICNHPVVMGVILGYNVITKIIRACKEYKMIPEFDSLTQNNGMFKTGVNDQGILTDRPKELETEYNEKHLNDFSEGIPDGAITYKSSETFNEKKAIRIAKGKDVLYFFPGTNTSEWCFDVMSALGTNNFLLIKSNEKANIKVVNSSFKEIGVICGEPGVGAMVCFYGTSSD